MCESSTTAHGKALNRHCLSCEGGVFGHTLCQYRLIRMIFFHANVTLPKIMRLNHGVAIRFERREDVPDVAGGGDAAPAATDPAPLLSVRVKAVAA